MNTSYDVIVIGSGIGGLSTASLLAQLAKKRVLVLERHFKLGGFTHSFSRKGYTWDVGLHYVGGVAPGSQGRQLFDFITGGKADWQKLPEHFDKFVYPDVSFAVPSSSKHYLATLIKQFPLEEVGLKTYFRDLERVAKGIGMEVWSWSAPRWLQLGMRLANRGIRRLAQMTTKAYLDKHFNDEKLKALLASQWGDYGLPPGQSSFATHALVAGSYLDGAWYPVGGAKTIAESIVPIIREAGGECLVNHEVAEILVEDGEAKGVKVKVKQGKDLQEKIFTAPLIISDAGAHTTFTKLLPEHLELPIRKELKNFSPGYTVVTLYLGFKESPAKLGFIGFKGENHWIYADYDHDKLMAESASLLEGKVGGVYLSLASLHDAKARQHTGQLIVPVDYRGFQQWSQSEWKHRGRDYEALKAKITEALLDFIEHRYPGFRELVAYSELSTPLTIADFTGHARGAIYGVPATPEKYQKRWFSVHTPIKNLLLTGTDVCSLGIQGALMGGVFAAGYALHPLGGFPRVLNAAKQYSKQGSSSSLEATHIQGGLYE